MHSKLIDSLARRFEMRCRFMARFHFAGLVLTGSGTDKNASRLTRHPSREYVTACQQLARLAGKRNAALSLDVSGGGGCQNALYRSMRRKLPPPLDNYLNYCRYLHPGQGHQALTTMRQQVYAGIAWLRGTARDMGPVDFATLRRRSTPNDALVCPPGPLPLCHSRGILAVEMEAAALYAFARSRDVAILCLAHVTNTMGQGGQDFEKGEADGTADALVVLAALVTIA